MVAIDPIVVVLLMMIVGIGTRWHDRSVQCVAGWPVETAMEACCTPLAAVAVVDCMAFAVDCIPWTMVAVVCIVVAAAGSRLPFLHPL